MKTRFVFTLMDKAVAEMIQTWHYEGPYAVYNMGSGEEGMTELLDRRSPYYSVRDEQEELVGFFNIGTSAQVGESIAPGIYGQDRTITIGLGMRPDVTGKGMGLTFVQACLDFARREFAPVHFQLYVLSWNTRAIRVYERAGFQRVRVFVQHNMHGTSEFLEMHREA